MKKILAIICVTLILAGLCGCAEKLENTQPDGEVISNDGIAIKKGDWIYFINGAMPEFVNDALADSPRAKIYRMKADGSELQSVTNKKAHSMYVYEDKIIYSSPTKTQVNIYCINIDGTGNKKITTVNADDIICFGDKGFALGTESIVRFYDYEGFEKKEFETGIVDDLGLSDNYIYYHSKSHAGTRRIEISTGNQEDVCSPSGKILEADDSTVFLMSTRIPFKVDANTKETVQISEALYRKTIINMKNRVIICVESDTESHGVYAQPIDNVAGRPVGEGENTPRVMIHTKSAAALCANDEYVFVVEEETGDIYKMTYQGTEKTLLGTMESVYNSMSIDVVGETLILFDGADAGNAYYVPIDGSGQLTVIKEQ